jgi:signal transduction histidine kinase
MRCKSIEDVISKSLAEVRNKLDVQVASLFLFTKEGIVKRVGICGVDKNNEPIPDTWLIKEDRYKPGDSFSGKAIPESGLDIGYGQPYYSNNILEEFGNMSNGKEYDYMLGGLRCGISVPLNGINRTFGTLEVLNKNQNVENGFTEDDVYWLMLIGTYVSNAIIEFRRQSKLQLYNYLNGKLLSLDASKEIALCDLNNIIQRIADSITSESTFFVACIIRIVNEKENLEIRGRSHSEDISWEHRVDESVKAGSQIVGEVYDVQQHREIVEIDQEIEKFNNVKWINHNDLKSFACFPLSIENQCVGTISVYTRFKYKLTNVDTRFLQNISFLTACLISKYRLIQELKQTQKDLNKARQELFCNSRLLPFESVLQTELHRYKNELIDLSQDIKKISGYGKNKISLKEKDRIAKSLINWIDKRVEQIQLEFQSISSPVPVPIDINQVLNEIINILLFDEKDITIHKEYSDSIPIIYVDEKRIKDVFFNIINNSIYSVNHSNNKNKKISIATNFIVSENIKYIQISIKDNGIGIKNEDKDKIFEKGFTTHKKHGGSGMGLYVVREIISDYGGKIYFLSKWGEGTTFFITIPSQQFSSI